MESGSKSKLTQIAYIILAIAALSCIIPFLLLIIGSLTDNNDIIKNGYSFFPKKWSLDAYEYLKSNSASLVSAYGVTVFTTVFGTAFSLLITSMLGYGLSRSDLPGRKILSFIVVFTLLFNGGLVPTYLMYTKIFHIKNTIWAQIFPTLLLSGFNVILMRSYFVNSIPQSLTEAARIDGAKEVTIYSKVVMPLSMPIMATIGLMVGVNYWNSWLNGLYYITDSKYFSVQNILNRILLDIRYLTTGMAGDVSGDLLARLPSASIRMAIAVTGVLPILVIYPFFQKYFVKGITLGAVKE